MRSGFYRHDRAMDVHGYFGVKYVGPNYIKAKVIWWVRAMELRVTDKIKIKRDDLPRWRKCSAEGVVF